MRSRLLAIGPSRLLALGLTAFAAAQLAAAAPSRAAVPPGPGSGHRHIVVLADPPLASYRGGIAGLAATSPAATGDAMLDVESRASARYLDHLDRAQTGAVAAIEGALGHPIIVQDHYRYALNGISTWLAPGEAERVGGLPGVILVERETIDALATDAGPAWSGAGGVWDGSALGRPEGSFGEGVVIGIIDTGINIDHPSFAAVDGEGYEHVNPRGAGNYLGWCDPSHPRYDARWACNDKLIGLWSHPAASSNPEDENGHGSHTASTAGGNRIAEAVLVGPTVSITRTISGVAPHANIAAYDACSQNGCDSTATVAAIDQAVADRVNVINYSIQVGMDSPWQNTRSLAFLAAREAGVFVAVAAGNSGPGPMTNWANAPWLLTIGNSTHNRTMTHALNLDGGDTPPPAGITGKGFTAGLPDPHPILYAKGVKNVDGVEDDGRCLRPFPADAFDSAIVLCDRGVAARVVKGENVKAGGAAGYILANTAADGASLVLDAHALPAVHVTYADGERIKTWLASGVDHNGEIGALVLDEAPVNGDVMNASSSRGPSLTSECCRRPDIPVSRSALLEVLKPDVTAPGTDILAAVATGGDRPAPEFDLMSGTSMASPHAAGAAALLRAVRPTWSPAAIHSALMTTARHAGIRKEDQATAAGPLDRGAGHIDIARAAQAGFVLEETGAHFRAADPDSGGDPKTLNLASFHDTACLINCSWERTLTSVAGTAVTWTAQAVDPAGVPVAVEPPVFTLAPGATQTIRVTASVAGLPPDAWAFADIVLAPSVQSIPAAHFPLAARPVAAELPPVVLINAEHPAGKQVVPGLRAIGITELAHDVHGMVQGEPHSKALVPDRTPGNLFDTPESTLIVSVTIPADTRRLVTEIASTPARDIDLYVLRDTGGGVPNTATLSCVSGGEASLEYCDVRDPAPGLWWVVARSSRGSDNPPDATTILTAVVPAADAGNLTATGPASVSAGTLFALDLAWNLPALAVGDRWYGAVSLGTDADNRGNLGVMAVDLVGVVTGSVGTPTPTATRATPTSTSPTPTRPAPTTPPVDEPKIFLPVLVKNLGGLGQP